MDTSSDESGQARGRRHGGNHHERSSRRKCAHIIHKAGRLPTGDEYALVKTESDEEYYACIRNERNGGVNSRHSPQTDSSSQDSGDTNDYYSLAGLIPKTGDSADDLVSQYENVVTRLNQAWEDQSHCLQKLEHLSQFTQRLTGLLLDYRQIFQDASIIPPGAHANDDSGAEVMDHESKDYDNRVQKRACYDVDDLAPSTKQAKVTSLYTKDQPKGGDYHYNVKMEKTTPPESPLPTPRSPRGGSAPSQMSRLSTANASSPSASCPKAPCLSLARKNTYRVLQTLSNVTVSKVMTRKPRSLLTQEIGLTHPKRGKSTLDMMVTTSLDGTIQFWNTRQHKVITTFSVAPHGMQSPQDITWLDDEFLLVAGKEKDGSCASNQLGFVQLNNVGEHHLGYSFHTMGNSEYPGSYTVVEGLECDDSAVRFAATGLDKQISLWEVGRSRDGRGLDIQNAQQVNWTTRHTSIIHALKYVPHRQSILSGGADCKLFLQHVDKSLPSMNFRYAHRVNTITLNPVDNDLALVTTSSTNRQMHMVDLRIPHPNVLLFGFQQVSNLTRYNFPSFSPDGTMVACGHNNDGGISLWDTRYIRLTEGPTQTLTLNSNRVVYPYFHPTDPCLIVLGVDGTVNFVNYKLAPPMSH
ncbi:hypothetical protein IWQ62_002086 [Dispira parvispora]|uniref:Uncharacterized protein n=1 Tax=Dispira parvispora TaxID=1520584 RepID=A0A9W8E7V3_9FUNG|nr:hypothetical protein IWQ62_002086 [Dispira parvispora]